jgi:hypothetical protein
MMMIGKAVEMENIDVDSFTTQEIMIIQKTFFQEGEEEEVKQNISALSSPFKLSLAWDDARKRPREMPPKKRRNYY